MGSQKVKSQIIYFLNFFHRSNLNVSENLEYSLSYSISRSFFAWQMTAQQFILKIVENDMWLQQLRVIEFLLLKMRANTQ